MRLFAAIRIPPEIYPAIQSAAQPLDGALGVKLLPPDNWHLTLRFFGELDGQKAREVQQALEAVRFSPFPIALFGAGAYPSVHVPRAIWIGGASPGAVDLATKIEEATRFLQLPQENRFSIHLTVARAPKSVADIEDFVDHTHNVAEFSASSFCLMNSRLLPQGAVYQVIKECPAHL